MQLNEKISDLTQKNEALQRENTNLNVTVLSLASKQELSSQISSTKSIIKSEITSLSQKNKQLTSALSEQQRSVSQQIAESESRVMYTSVYINILSILFNDYLGKSRERVQNYPKYKVKSNCL